MKIFTKQLWKKEEYTYNTFTDFIPNITAYVHDTEEVRPTIIVVPGGGYVNVSPTEGEVVALKFLEKGYNAFVLTYSVRASKEMEPVRFQALRDLAKAMVMIKENANEWKVDTNKICTIGFSAGGHLVSSLGVHYDKEFLDDIKRGYDIRPNAQILSYPVITTTENFAHIGSKNALLGVDATEEEIEFMSTEKQITENTPPTFIWHCVGDESVPVENALEFAKSLKNNNIDFGLHIYPFGSHGISTCDLSWVKIGFNANSYAYELNRKLMERKLEKGDINFSKEEYNNMEVENVQDFVKKLNEERTFKDVELPEYRHAKSWTKLVTDWLDVVL